MTCAIDCLARLKPSAPYRRCLEIIQAASNAADAPQNLPELGVSLSDKRLIGRPAIVTWFALWKPRPSPTAPNAGFFGGMRLSRRAPWRSQPCHAFAEPSG